MSAHMLVVTDALADAKNMLATMMLSAERGASAFQPERLQDVDEGLGIKFIAVDPMIQTLAGDMFQRSTLETVTLQDSINKFAFKVMINRLTTKHLFGIWRRSGSLDVEFSIRICLIHPDYLAEIRPNSDKLWELFQEMDASAKVESVTAKVARVPNFYGMIFVTRRQAETLQAESASIDRVFSATTLQDLTTRLNKPLHLALAITDLEPVFTQIDFTDPEWRACGNHRTVAWKPMVLPKVLQHVIWQRPHLVNLMRNGAVRRWHGGKGHLSSLTVTAVFPHGFNMLTGAVNYDPVARRPILNFNLKSAIAFDESELRGYIPFQCADPLLSILLGKASDCQLTPERFAMLPPPPQAIWSSRMRALQ